MDETSRDPSPGKAKIFSMTTAPEIRNPTLIPNTVIINIYEDQTQIIDGTTNPVDSIIVIIIIIVIILGIIIILRKQKKSS